MKSVNWLLEKNIFFDTESKMCEIIRNHGHNVKLIEYIPVLHEIKSIPFSENSCIVFYGSLNAASVIKKLYNLYPGIYGTFPNYDYITYSKYFRDFMLNKDFDIYPYYMLLNSERMIYDMYGVDDTVFIRPDSGMKPFTGRTVSRDEFEKVVTGEFTLYGDISPDSICIVSSPKTIVSETRFVIVDDEIITGSEYRRDGKHYESDTPDAVQWFFLENMIEKTTYRPDRVWIADTCITSDDKIHLLEIGSFSCSGLYKNNLDVIVEKVSNVALEMYKKGV